MKTISTLQTTHYELRTSRAFTLVETLVAITVLSLSIVAPMTLASQSLASALYARDQVTAFHLAQEAIEAVRSARDANILKNVYGPPPPPDLLEGIPTNSPFVIDTRDNTMTTCSGACPPLKTDGTFFAYGPVGTSDIYGTQVGWSDTRFTRTITARFLPDPPGDPTDEIRIAVTIQWKTGAFQVRTFTISENLYRWLSTN